MTDKARELLEAALDHLHGMNSYEDCLLKNRIRAYLAEPEVKPLSANKAYLDGLSSEWRKRNTDIVNAVVWGIRFAEKHHGIGGDDDKQS